MNVLFILKVANIRCFILVKYSEQKARFKNICYDVVINQQFRTCASAFPNEFTVRSYDIMKNFNCNISLWFFKSKFRSYIGKHFFRLKQRPVCLSKLNSKLKTCIVSVVLLISKYYVDTGVSPKT